MDIIRRIKPWIGSLLLAILVVSCGGGDSGDSSPQTRATGTISGNVYDAPIAGSTVYIWEFQNGKLGRLLATTKTDAFGNYSTSIESASMPLFISAQGGAYIDPVSQSTVSDNNGKTIRMDSVINYSEGVNQNLMVTPLTNMVAGLTEFKIANQGANAESAISESLSTIDEMYGFDVNSVLPVDITKGGQSSYATDGHKYGALLTAYSSIADDFKSDCSASDCEQLYTSINLADIQYRDISSTGQLDGYEADLARGGTKRLSYGTQEVTSDLYTNTMSQHVLIVVNDPSLNLSGTKAADYDDFSTKINQQGTPGHEGGGAIPPRDEKPMSTEAPKVKRLDSDVLAGAYDQLELELDDDIGVESVTVDLQFTRDGFAQTVPCSTNGIGDGYCELSLEKFEKGKRITKADVYINTLKLDGSEGQSRATNTKLVVYTSDVVGNQRTANQGNGMSIEFEWDNDAPVIEFSSPTTISSATSSYLLSGLVKDSTQGIKSVSIQFENQAADDYECIDVTGPKDVGYHCQFSEIPRDISQFVSEAMHFYVTAIDAHGNKTTETRTVTRDNTPPTQQFSYPTQEVTFVDAQGNESPGYFNDSTFTEQDVQSADRYLKINYAYAKYNLIESFPEVDFEHFTSSVLEENHIPYIKVVVSDPDGGTLSGSSANSINLKVNYFVKGSESSSYSEKNRLESMPLGRTTIGDEIPHETIVLENDRADQLVYYIPLTRDILGSSFSNVSRNAIQKLAIQTVDESGNKSEVKEIFFKTSFDLPTIKVVTPFIGVTAQLEGLADNNQFVHVKSCTTTQQQELSTNNPARDVASCDLFVDNTNYTFIRVRLATNDQSNAYYYQWKDDESSRVNVNLSSASMDLGAYFELSGSTPLYITELSSYQTGLFDYYWNNTSNKSLSTAKVILGKVNDALASGSSSFFGFNPIETKYATNEMLRLDSDHTAMISDPVYRHRYLVEGLSDLATDKTLSSASVDFAQAFYNDFSADGKPDGVGSGGESVSSSMLGYTITPETYRKDLASYFYDLVTKEYNVQAPIAMSYADRYAEAAPTIDGKKVFDQDAVSIDNSPPTFTPIILDGKYYYKGNALYVAGAISSQVTIDDPSGLAEQPSLTPYYFTKEAPNTKNDIDLGLELISENGYEYRYQFTLDTQSESYSNMMELALDVLAQDDSKNKNSLNAIFSYNVDNDYPVIEYQQPKGVSDPETDYLNGNIENELTFNVKDSVGDDADKRKLIFTNSDQESETFSLETFATSSPDSFSVKLCKDCSGIYPKGGDGNWTVRVEAEDHLGNKVTASTPDAPVFMVNLDSQAPEFNMPETVTWLGGNSEWKLSNILDWGRLSPAGSVAIDLRKFDGTNLSLAACDVNSQHTCIQGEVPNIRVQLFEGDFEYSKENLFTITAKDSALPNPNQSVGKFSFKIDNVGPSIKLADPQVTDSKTQESYVLGNQFTINIASLTDDMGVDTLSLYQADNEQPIKSQSIDLDMAEGDKSYAFKLNADDVEKLDLSESNKVVLQLRAVDINGFESKIVPMSEVLIDREGPGILLIDYDKVAFYSANYPFTTDIYDYGSDGLFSADGVDVDKTRYWLLYNGEEKPDTSYGGTPLSEGKVVLANRANGNTIVLLKAVDVRGNESTKEFTVQVHDSAPEAEFVVQYEDGSDIQNSVVTKANAGLKLTLTASDVSGVKTPTVNFYYQGEQEISRSADFKLVSGTVEDGVWEASVPASEFGKDGDFILSITAGNNTRYTQMSDNKEWKETHKLTIQRQGVKLLVPEGFSATVANKKLTVGFSLENNDITVESLQCWIRNNYQGEGVPTDQGPTSGVINNPNPVSCTVESAESFDSPVLITRAIGSNGAESIQKFSFAMMDVEPPSLATQANITMQADNVSRDSGNGKKMYTLVLSYRDDLSGVELASEQHSQPYLEKNSATKIVPTECHTSGGGTATCSYTSEYTNFIGQGESSSVLKIRSLYDVAGNSAQEEPTITLTEPQGSLEASIVSPQAGDYIDENPRTIEFRYKLYDNTKLEGIESIEADVGGIKSYPTGKIKQCEDDPSYLCVQFESKIPEVADGSSLNVTVRMEDIWGETASDTLAVKVDNQAPVIGDTVNVILAEDPTKARFKFDISDFSSGLQKVSYRVTPEHQASFDLPVKEVGNGVEEGELSYFDLDTDSLLDVASIKVSIIATDKLGHEQIATKTLDVSSPSIVLELTNVGSSGNVLVFERPTQQYSLSAENMGLIKPKSYKVELLSDSKDDILQSGGFTSDSVFGEWDFTASQQGKYKLKVTTTDQIGRETTGFMFGQKSYADRELYVDFDKPEIGSVYGEQKTFTPQNGYYEVDVHANISDANLSQVSAQLHSNATGQTYYSEVEVVPNQAEYVFAFNVPASDYQATVKAVDKVGNENTLSGVPVMVEAAGVE
ncbi:hypothetical protein M9194_18750 [Vibrio sp. S4M6]|uniref:hypothetical protein n=1 Tax=Vibrio sinus TaxID=2946865 RepID=UPI00202AB4D0|nr:hypothetical protein [Vibrio sinus]MCL9783470.1 hypothetical protein [Vibrio sinus]